MREQIEKYCFLPLVKSPRVIYSGKVFCAGDAAKSADINTGGFGGIAGDLYFISNIQKNFVW